MMQAIRVVKLGGSLLDFPELPKALSSWLSRQNLAVNVVVAGGGPMADAVRQMDTLYRVGDEAAHWTCISAMGVTARVTAALLQTALVDRYEELLKQLDRGEITRVVFAVEEFLRRHEPTRAGQKLTRDWRTTSDAIAARLAVVLEADELVLLKSTDLPAGASRKTACAHGLVDEHFACVAGSLPVRWVNLRSRAQRESQL